VSTQALRPPARVLVTGAAGFIGAYVCQALLARGDSVIGIDSFNDYYSPQLKHDRVAALLGANRTVVQQLDLTDTDALRELVLRSGIERIVHLAAQAGVRYSLEAPFKYADANLLGFLSVLEAARAGKVQHLVYASSSSVYGGNRRVPFSESDPTDTPISLYAASKKANEAMAHSYAHLYGIPATGLRFFTVYGPWGRPDMAPLLFTRALLERRPIEVFNGGDMQRDFTHISDIVNGVLGALDHPASAEHGAPHQIFNLGNHRPERLNDFIELIEQAVGESAVRVLKPMQPGDVPITFANISRAAAAFGYAPSVALKDGIPPLVAWCRSYFAAPNSSA